jgi:hypothetical protein
MTELIIEYDESNKTVEKVLNAMISSGVIRKKDVTAKSRRISEFKQALHETKEMVENITSGVRDYETMDDFLKSL